MIAFFTLAYGFSWAMLLTLYGLLRLPAALVILLQTLGPTLAALVTASVLEGPAGRRRLLARVRIWRVPRRWYLFALVGIPAVCVLAALVLPGAFVGLGGQPAMKLRIEFLAFVVVGFVSGPLFEEPGWRGFALPHL
jgi:membrane protease YdiL (CAAX protease family)